MIRFDLYITEEQKEFLEKISKEQKIPMGEVVRQCIEQKKDAEKLK